MLFISFISILLFPNTNLGFVVVNSFSFSSPTISFNSDNICDYCGSRECIDIETKQCRDRKDNEAINISNKRCIQCPDDSDVDFTSNSFRYQCKCKDPYKGFDPITGQCIQCKEGEAVEQNSVQILTSVHITSVNAQTTISNELTNIDKANEDLSKKERELADLENELLQKRTKNESLKREIARLRHEALIKERRASRQ